MGETSRGDSISAVLACGEDLVEIARTRRDLDIEIQVVDAAAACADPAGVNYPAVLPDGKALVSELEAIEDFGRVRLGTQFLIRADLGGS